MKKPYVVSRRKQASEARQGFSLWLCVLFVVMTVLMSSLGSTVTEALKDTQKINEIATSLEGNHALNRCEIETTYQKLLELKRLVDNKSKSIFYLKESEKFSEATFRQQFIQASKIYSRDLLLAARKLDGPLKTTQGEYCLDSLPKVENKVHAFQQISNILKTAKLSHEFLGLTPEEVELLKPIAAQVG